MKDPNHSSLITLIILIIWSQILPCSLKDTSIRVYCCFVWLVVLSDDKNVCNEPYGFLLVKIAYLDFNFGDSLLQKKFELT